MAMDIYYEEFLVASITAFVGLSSKGIGAEEFDVRSILASRRWAHADAFLLRAYEVDVEVTFIDAVVGIAVPKTVGCVSRVLGRSHRRCLGVTGRLASIVSEIRVCGVLDGNLLELGFSGSHCSLGGSGQFAIGDTCGLGDSPEGHLGLLEAHDIVFHGGVFCERAASQT